MTGRITTRHLPLAEKSCPGIGALYRELEDKPATFLQLLWIYEARRAGMIQNPKRSQPRRRR
ncbi:MAG: hypothetical protein K8M05_34170 [Deltaproteobacteria bacterium]|nr:hypothetical protein [Kofleriaceae bacterium]